MTSGKAKLLLIGPRAIDGDVLGGTKVSFESLVDYYSASKVWSPDVINLSRRGGNSRVRRFLANLNALVLVIYQVCRKARRSALVFLNISSNGLLMAGPLIWLAARLSGKPLVIRVFGGDFDEVLENTGIVTQWLANRTYLRSDLLLFQTKALVQRFSKQPNVQWLPTSRSATGDGRIRTSCRKLLFVAQLRAEKGVPEILSVAKELSDSISISIYGAKMPGFDAAQFGFAQNVNYGGEVAHDVVLAEMDRHDVLLFPSYYDGEGYPGVIIEAMQKGMPVIATNWKALPELIEHERNGLLIEPRSATQLGEAISRLVEDENLVRKLSEGALACGREYSAAKVNARIDNLFQELSGVSETGSCVV